MEGLFPLFFYGQILKKCYNTNYGSIAQLGERLGHNQKVMGSSPVASIIIANLVREFAREAGNAAGVFHCRTLRSAGGFNISQCFVFLTDVKFWLMLIR